MNRTKAVPAAVLNRHRVSEMVPTNWPQPGEFVCTPSGKAELLAYSGDGRWGLVQLMSREAERRPLGARFIWLMREKIEGEFEWVEREKLEREAREAERAKKRAVAA
jgi:hypothetical protein